MKKVTVIGIGQMLRGDDAAGLEAVHRWQRAFPQTAATPGLTVQFSELPGLALLDMLEGFNAALLVDAVQASGRPGTVYRLGPEDLASFDSGSKSAHGWGVAETLKLHWQLNPADKVRIRLVGIEAAQMELGKSLSLYVDQGLALAVEIIEAEVKGLLSRATFG